MADHPVSSTLRRRDKPPKAVLSVQRSRLSPYSPSREHLPLNMDPNINPQSASPEVISNLIISLSAISTPVENHFKNLPDVDDNPSGTSYEPQPILRVGHNPRNDFLQSPSRPVGCGKDPWTTNNVPEEWEDPDMGTNEAALAPVVHLVKPTVSPLSLSNRTNSPSRLSFKRSQRSLVPEDAMSIGIANTEHNLLASSASIAPSIRSGRSRDIKRTTSKDAVLDSNSLSPLRSGNSSEGLGMNIVGGSAKTLRPTLSNRSLTDGMIQVFGTKLDLQGNGSGGRVKERSNSTLAPVSPHDSTSSVSITNGTMIPSRHSSLRHSIGGSPGVKQQTRSTKKRHSFGSKDLSHLNIDPDLIEEDHQTVRRIRELQEAKEKRERDIRRGERSKLRGPMAGTQTLQHSASNQSSPLSSSGVVPQTAEQNSEVENGSEPDSTNPSATEANHVIKHPLAVSASNPQAMPTAASASQGSDPGDRTQLRRYPRPTSPMRHHRTFSKEKTRSGRNSAAFDRPDSANSIEESVDNYVKSARLTQRVRHPQSGRVITFSDVGDPEGFAVFCCVGMGLTRYLTAFYDELARTLRLRLITPDRPGIGESEACTDGSGTPLNWADDVTIICNHLGITKFSLLAHSAGAVYALAIALRLPQQIRGRLHLMAPWIPPSQMTGIGSSQKEMVPAANVPYSQKILRVLPASFLKAANSSFLNARSASLNKSPRPKPSKRRSLGTEVLESPFRQATTATWDKRNTPSPTAGATGSASIENHEATSNATFMHGIGAMTNNPTGPNAATVNVAVRQSNYDERLTQRIWDLATLNANPAVDLLVCLERRQPIGFRYSDITRSVVIHHGSKDTRVPIDNVRWLGKLMRRCEVRILEGEGHGLMANASVMGSVLGEVAKEWEDWWNVTQSKGERENKRRERAEERYQRAQK